MSNETTLDRKHLEKIEYFKRIETVELPHLEKQYNDLMNKTTLQNKLGMIDYKTQADILCNRITRLKEEKKKYYNENLIHIFNYFETKKSLESLTLINKSATKDVDLFFGIKKQQHSETQKMENEHNQTATSIMKQYLSNIDDTYVDINSFILQKNACSRCGNGEWVMYEEDNFMACSICKAVRSCLVHCDNLSQSEKSKEVSSYAYKRINHFKEIVSQFQGKETTHIPEEVFDKIRVQVKRERLEISSEHLTYETTKDILKKLGYNKLYEHIPYIKHRLGISPPLMSQELEEFLYTKFAELQTPYSKYCPDNRTNFLNYYFTLYKLCELAGAKQYLKDIPMLKDKEKRIEQAIIWQKICKEKNWTLYSTD